MATTLYNVFFSSGVTPLDRDWSYLAVDQHLLDRLVGCYLRGGYELVHSGTTYEVASYYFQVYRLRPELGNNPREISNTFRNLATQQFGGDISENIMEDTGTNVTAEILDGRKSGDLKSDLFNVYLNLDGEKKVRTAVSKEDLLMFILSWQAGEANAWLEGTNLIFRNPTVFKVFDIDLKHRKAAKGQTKKHIAEQLRIRFDGTWSTRALTHFGKEVTHEFKIGGFGAMKPSEIKIAKEGNVRNQTKTGKIFISHSSKDLDIVNKFIDSILLLGLELKREDLFCTSADGTTVKSGLDFRDAIKLELIGAKAVIQVITKNYKSSEVCLNEMGAAWVTSQDVIPFIASPFNYDVGFIHASSQQLMLNKREDLLKFYDDHNGKLFGKVNLTNYSRQVDVFVEFMNARSVEQAVATERRFFFQEEVTVRGILHEDIFQHPNGSHHRFHFVELQQSVDVLSNELSIDEGDFNTTSLGITRMHVFLAESLKIELRKFNNKSVTLVGKCWGGHTAWHQTRVMMTVKEIKF
jgi:hypothetical protein